MKGVRVGGAAVGKGEVDCDTKLDLTASEYILQEGVPLVEVGLQQIDLLRSRSAISSVKQELCGSLADLRQVEGNVAKVCVLAGLAGLEELDFDLALGVFVGHLRSEQ